MNKISIDSMDYRFMVNDHVWQFQMAKSQTRVKDIRQLILLTENTEYFVPAVVEEAEDFFTFTYTANKSDRAWSHIMQLNRADKLRLLCNVAQFHKLLSTRTTFFLHPDNLLFDDNLMPHILYRGIRDVVPPFSIDEEKFFQQYKCLIIALFSKKYTFDELYSGSLKNAGDTEFERIVVASTNFNDLLTILKNHYQQEKILTESSMQFVPKKRFRLYKQLTYSLIGLSILLAVPLAYFIFGRVPEQNHLLAAHGHFLSNEYSNVITDLEGEDPSEIPNSGKYILAYSYIMGENVGPNQREVIMKNISTKSDENYLLYWIYNGKGDFDKSMDLAKYIDDPHLIMYGLVKQIESAQKNPELSGTEREEKVSTYKEQLKNYREKYGLGPLEGQDEQQNNGSESEEALPVQSNEIEENKLDKKDQTDVTNEKKEDKAVEKKKEENPIEKKAEDAKKK